MAMDKSSGDAEKSNAKEIKEIFSQDIRKRSEDAYSVPSIKLPDSVKIAFNRVQTFAADNFSNVEASDFFLFTCNSIMLVVGFLQLGVTGVVVSSCYFVTKLSNNARVPVAITASLVSGIMVLTSTWFNTFCINTVESMRLQLNNILCAIKFLIVTICCLIAGVYFMSRVRTQIVLTAQIDEQHSDSTVPIKEIVQVHETYYHTPTDWNNVELMLDTKSAYYTVTKQELQRFMLLYNSSRRIAHYWDVVQNEYSCCGIESPSNWKQEGYSIPPQSCCVYSQYTQVENSTGQCSYTYTSGCLDRIGLVIAWYASLLLGITLITLIITVNTFILLVYIYFNSRRNQR